MMLLTIYKEVLGLARKKHLKTSTVLSASATAVGDLLQPVWQKPALSAGIFALLLTAALFLVWKIRNGCASWPLNPMEFEEKFKGPALLLLVSLFGVAGTSGIYAWREVAGTSPDQSIIAEHSTLAKSLQEQLGVTNRQLASVEREMHTISADTKASRETLDKIAMDTEKISHTMENVKKETSDNPRKELANMGISWTTDSFTGAILRAEMQTLELFLQGGMKLVTPHKGTSLAVYALQPGIPDRVEIMKLFMKYGFKLDTELVDTRLMPMRGMGSRPDHFEHPKLSPKYGAWNKTFAGSALFWIVCVSAYEGASPEDYELLEFLVANGADTTLSLAYMKLPYRTTPVEKELLVKLQRFITARK